MGTTRQLIRRHGEMAINIVDFVAGIVFAVSVVSFHPTQADEQSEDTKIDYVVGELEKARWYGMVGLALLMLSFVLKIVHASVQ